MKAGIPSVSNRIPIEQLRDMYERQGLSSEEIANQLGCTRQNVTSRLSKAGVILPKGRPSNWP